MKKYETKIWECAIKTGLSQLQIWSLIRNNLIGTYQQPNEIRVNYKSLRDWMRNHRTLIEQMRLDVDIRDFDNPVDRFFMKIRQNRALVAKRAKGYGKE